MALFAGFERTWPRPRVPCVECSGELVLKWGEHRRPHFSHINKSGCGGGEGTMHRLAKEGLAGVLTLGGSLEFIWSCPTCHQLHTKIIILQPGEQAVVECQVPNGWADVAVVAATGEVRFIIEVMDTHQTEVRDGEWVEVCAQDCLKQMNQETHSMSLRCKRPRVASSEDKCWMALQDRMGYKENGEWTLKQTKLVSSAIWNWFIKVRRCLMCFQPHEVKRARPFCKACYFKLSPKPVPKSPAIIAPLETSVTPFTSRLDKFGQCGVCRTYTDKESLDGYGRCEWCQVKCSCSDCGRPLDFYRDTLCVQCQKKRASVKATPTCQPKETQHHLPKLTLAPPATPPICIKKKSGHKVVDDDRDVMQRIDLAQRMKGQCKITNFFK